jgi:hypothetical protein
MEMPPEQHPGHDRSYKGKVIVHARKHPGAIALCGLDAGWGESTTSRSRVTCPACAAQVETRLEKRRTRG